MMAHIRMSSVPTSSKGALAFELVKDTQWTRELVSLAKRTHEDSRFAYIAFSPTKVERTIERALADPRRHGLMVCRAGTSAVGAAHCSVGEYHVGTGTLVTTIHVISVHPEVRQSLLSGKVALGLVAGIETWSAARGAVEIFLHVTSGIGLERSHRLAKRIGFECIGGSYAKRIS